MKCNSCKHWRPERFSKEEQIMTVDVYCFISKEDREMILREVDFRFCSLEDSEHTCVVRKNR